VTWWAMVPNGRGVDLARHAGVDHLTVTISASDGYSRKNFRRSTAEAVDALAEIATAADGVAAIDVIVSCAFGSPFDDVIDPSPTVWIVDRALQVVLEELITLSDTTGTATPRRIDGVVAALPESFR